MSAAAGTVAETVPFGDLCKCLDAVGRARGADQRRARLRAFIESWRGAHAKLHGDIGDLETTEDSFYPAMRLILPSYDKERGSYGFKEHMLAKRLIEVFCLGASSVDARCLLNYKVPRAAGGGGAAHLGDFASTAADVLRLRLAAECTLTVAELNDRLDSIVGANAEKAHDKVKQELQLLSRSVTEIEMKWLIRILLKQMKIGMQEASVFREFHKDASQLYDVTTSLREVCQKLRDPSVSLDEIQIALFHPFRPMLAMRAPPEKVPKIMDNKPFYVETKYDGERVQVHRERGVYKYFSRNGNDFTSSYGGDARSGSLTGHIDAAFAPHVRSCILDAEMVGWNPIAQCVATKGEQFDVKSLKPGDELQPCLVLFDCLMLNGTVLCARPMHERVALLRTVLRAEVPGRIVMGQRKMVTDVAELVAALNCAIDQREEGLVAKRTDSLYALNTRSEAAGWLKIKPDYIDALNDDFDLLIVGGYFGEGARANLLSHFLLALAEETTGGDKPARFKSVCKVGSGYSHKELFDLNRRLMAAPQLVRADKRAPVPDWLQVGYEKPDVYIRPESSKILQVRAAEITVSTGYAAGHTLRFPRAQKVRDDKAWHECMTVQQFERLRAECAGKTSHRYQLQAPDAASGDAAGSPAAKKRRAPAARRFVPPTVPEALRPDTTACDKVADVLDGKEICVLAAGTGAKRELERLAKQLGASVSQHAGADTFCVLADSADNVRASNVISRGTVTVAKADWLRQCYAERRLLPWTPGTLYRATARDLELLSADYDRYGDGWRERSGADGVRRLLTEVVPDGDWSPAGGELIAQLEEECACGTEYSLFRGLSFFIDGLGSESAGGDGGARALHSAHLVRLYGGKLAAALADCSHAVVSTSDAARLSAVDAANRGRRRRFRLVSDRWLRTSADRGTVRDELADDRLRCAVLAGGQ